MKSFRRTIAVLSFLLTFCILAGCGGDQSQEASEAPASVDQALPQIADILAALATRPGISDQAVVARLQTAAVASATVFVEVLGGSGDTTSFANSLAPLLQTFDTDYQAAATTDDKAIAVRQLLDGLIASAMQCDISPDRFDLAFLSAAADLQSQFPSPPLSENLTAAEVALASLLLQETVDYLHQSTFLQRGSAALVTLSADAALITQYEQLVAILNNSQIVMLNNLETAVADPTVNSDSGRLIVEQLNLAAVNNLFWGKYGMSMGLPQTGLDLDRIIIRMNDTGGIMTGVTVDTLEQSGVVETMSVTTPDGTVLQPALSPVAFVAYDWTRPAMSLTYQPLSFLIDQLQQIGGTVPTSPDFTPFADPYLAVFQLKYDCDLDNELVTLEWNGLDASSSSALQEQLSLRLATDARLQQILAGFSGASEQEKAALATLLVNPR